MEKEILLTKERVEELKVRLEELERIKREELPEELKEARSHGDLSENAEYDAAKEKQAEIEGEIVDINYQLTYAKIIEESKLTTRSVQLGSTFELVNRSEKGGVAKKYKLVGTTEADIMNGKMSNESPIGRAVIGKKKGENFKVNTPAGEMTFAVLSISK